MKKFYDTVIDQATGQPRQNATVTVTDGTGAAVQLYSDDGITPIENPINRVVTDVNGLFQFYVANGTYTLTIQYAGATPVVLTGISIIEDVTVIDALGSSTVNPPSQKATTDAIAAVVIDSMGTSTTSAPSQNAIASSTAAAGIGASDGNTVQDNLSKIAFNAAAAFIASDQASQGEGSIWRAGRHSYKEAASDATDSHVTNAAGVKFYVIPSSLGYDLEAFGCDMTGTNDSASIVQAAANMFPNGGTLIIPPGTLKLGSGVTMPPRLSLVGAGPTLTMVTCVGDGFDWQGSAADQAQTLVGNFAMSGAGRTTGTAITGAGGAALNRIQGMRFLNITVNNFNIAFQGRSCWHTNFIGCRVNNCSFGIRLEGQCVKILIHACEITSLGSVYNDGSMGIYVDQYIYDDSVSRRPEDVVIDADIVYGYDRNIFINRALTCSIVNSDIDAALRVGIEGATVDYGFAIDRNWIAVIHNTSGTTGVLIDALGAANSAQVSISGNRVSATGTYASSSNGIQVNGSNRTGVISVKDNNIGMGAGFGVALYLNSASKCTVCDNNLLGAIDSLNSENGGGHYYDRNRFNGSIRRVGTRVADYFGTTNTGSAATGFRGRINIPPSATTVTLDPVNDLGLPAAPVTGLPASLVMIAHAYQYTGSTSRGAVRAYYDNTNAKVVVTVDTAEGVTNGDVWLDLFAI